MRSGTDDGGTKAGIELKDTGIRSKMRLPGEPGKTLNAPRLRQTVTNNNQHRQRQKYHDVHTSERQEG